MSNRIVLALGGNAILTDDATAAAQRRALYRTSTQLCELVKRGHELVISHGNGPQVGNLYLQQKAGESGKNPAMPMDTCVAMTQGSIGYSVSYTHLDVYKRQAKAGMSGSSRSILIIRALMPIWASFSKKRAVSLLSLIHI